MNGFPTDGPQPRTAEFLRRMATAYEMLAVVYELSKEEQLELCQWFTKKQAEILTRKDNAQTRS